MTKGGGGIQVDKGGFVRIHHEILEALATAPLRGQQFRCLMFLFRTTYGFNRKEVKLSLAEWTTGTKMRRQNVWRELHTLMNCNVIHGKSNGAKRAMTWGFNKYYEQWNFESVITDDYRFVITDDYTKKESVINVDDRSVITPPHAQVIKTIKTTTTTTTTEGSGSSSSESFPDLQNDVLRCWRENMTTPLTPIITADLKKCVTDHGATDVMEAIAVAVRADNHTMRYVKGVLNRRASRGDAAGLNGANTREVLVRIGDDND